MDLSMLTNIGFTDGEIRVYKAALELGQARVFDIIKRSGISTSKAYIILDKLIRKGVISYTVEHNHKFYQATHPRAVLDFVERKKHELDEFKDSFAAEVPKIEAMRGVSTEETARVNHGIRGARSAYEGLFDEMEKGEEYCFLGVQGEAFKHKIVTSFFRSYHRMRIAKGIKVRGIVDQRLKKKIDYNWLTIGQAQIRYYKLAMPQGIAIGKNRVLLLTFGEETICFELISARIAKRYRDFFNKIWKVSKA